MNDRRIYHARGKLLGGSSSINGMIFQRGNPMDFERWAARPGTGAWDYAHCLPYFKRMETCLAGADEWRGRRRPARARARAGGEPAVRGVLRGGAAGRVRAHRGRQRRASGGLRAVDRNIHRGRRLSAARAYLHPVRRRPNLDVRCRAFVTRVLFDGTRATGVEVVHRGRTEVVRGRRGDPLRRGDQHAAAPPALGGRQRGRARGARHRRRPRPAGRRGEPPGPPRGVRPARIDAAGLGRAAR